MSIFIRFYSLNEGLLSFLYFWLDRSGGPSKGQGCDEKAKFLFDTLKTSKTAPAARRPALRSLRSNMEFF